MQVPWRDFALLEEAGFGGYEKRALVTLAVHGVADAALLCREGGIPSSKIYAAMEKLRAAGLVELRRRRPKLYAALDAEQLLQRLRQLVDERAHRFGAASEQLRQAFERLPGRLQGRQGQVDMALGAETHVKRHLSRLALARRRVLSYLEATDLDAITQAKAGGFDLMKTIAGEHESAGVEHRILFGMRARTAARVVEFLREHAAAARRLTGLRYSGEMGHPFHVVDDRSVILAVDHPFAPSGRVASLLIEDAELASQLAGGFEALWRKALADLREIRGWPSQTGVD